MQNSPGKKFKKLVTSHAPVQILGTINAFCALLAEKAHAKAIYLSGAGVANASYGLPDLGMTNLKDVLEDITRITAVTNTPLLVDIDTGWGNELNIARTIKLMQKAQVAAVHIEDQEFNKRCGHRPNKKIVTQDEMVNRVKAAVDAKIDEDFVIIARTDALANEGLTGAIDRANAYLQAGADMIFPEAFETLNDYKKFTQQVNAPVLANITEFGKTPLFTKEELSQAGVKLILYPLSAFRAMSKAALDIYNTILREGTQKTLLNQMQSRSELYDVLNYQTYEDKLN